MSTVGEPQQLTVRLAREMLKEIEHDEKILKRSQRGSDKKRTKLFKQLTQKFGLQIWKTWGPETQQDMSKHILIPTSVPVEKGEVQK